LIEFVGFGMVPVKELFFLFKQGFEMDAIQGIRHLYSPVKNCLLSRVLPNYWKGCIVFARAHCSSNLYGESIHGRPVSGKFT
jgi:hypothetical protein